MAAVILLDILSILGLAGAYYLDYFTVRRIGMLRWVNYYVNRWQKTLPMDVFAAAAAAVLVLLCAGLLLKYRTRRESLSPVCRIGFFFVLIPVGAFIVCAAVLSVKTTRAYYFMLMALAASALVQIIKDALLLRAGIRK